mmetsp:Transcript_28618/g.84733  ORF Transcript_28618/g.84733 Transcript_28618/m.84733 type:complete len:84 (-) Transcript_28618:288-539(-)
MSLIWATVTLVETPCWQMCCARLLFLFGMKRKLRFVTNGQGWGWDLLDIGDSVGAKMFKVPKYMIVKGHGLETDDVTALIAKI